MKKQYTLPQTLALLLIIVFVAQVAFAKPATVETRQLSSSILKRTVNYDVILPSDYADNNWRYPVLYLLQGLGGHYDSWVIASNLATYAEKHKLIIVTPESADGWWTDSATDANDKYESYMLQEVLPLIDKNYRTLPFRKYRGIAGLSMGGYGALKFAVKYPDKFAFAASMSGALDAATAVERNQTTPWTPAMWAFCKPSLARVFGAADSATRKANDLFALYGAVSEAGARDFAYIYSDCGAEDPFFDANWRFAELLRERKIAHEFRERPGAHTWYYWDEQVQGVLDMAERKLTDR